MYFEGQQISTWEFQQQIRNALESRSLVVTYPPAPYKNEHGQQGTFVTYKLDGKYILISRSKCISLPSPHDLGKEISIAKDVTTHNTNYKNDHGILGGCCTLHGQDGHYYMVGRTDVRETVERWRQNIGFWAL